jgi:sigma-B regulation protein RsbU (phosphoserine phosphatase)
MALGLDEDAEYEQAEISILPGDTLFMFTDGVSEAMNNKREQFGEDAIKSVLGAVAGGTSEQVVSAVKGAVQEHVGTTPPHDDITMFCLRRSS